MKAQCDLDEIYIKIVSYQKANFGSKKFVKKSTSPEISHLVLNFQGGLWAFKGRFNQILMVSAEGPSILSQFHAKKTSKSL